MEDVLGRCGTSQNMSTWIGPKNYFDLAPLGAFRDGPLGLLCLFRRACWQMPIFSQCALVLIAGWVVGNDSSLGLFERCRLRYPSTGLVSISAYGATQAPPAPFRHVLNLGWFERPSKVAMGYSKEKGPLAAFTQKDRGGQNGRGGHRSSSSFDTAA